MTQTGAGTGGTQAAGARAEAPARDARAEELRDGAEESRSGPAPTVRVLALAGIVAVLVLAALASVAFGARTVGFDDILSALGGAQDTVAQAAVAKRIPRTLLALLVGAALGTAGAVLQGVTRNPLADPTIFGINNGAALAVVVGITFFGLSSPHGYIWVALTGAALTGVLVYTIGSMGGGGSTPLKLALAGAATTIALSSLSSAIILPRAQVMDMFRFWEIGGVGGGTYESLARVVPFLLVGFVLSVLSARGLNSLALGDEMARGLGVSVGRTRILASAGAVILCGASTAVAGPIGFVGLVVPHVCRLLFGPDHRWLLPLSALAGAVLLTVADVLGRVVTRPEELEVGIVTAFVGAPVFILIVRRMKVREL
ncbi:iron ABC transporter permease [Brevibacterium salitolerans]|uniref:Iron ABC transporter permease n=1 Tax=Brevibacterium salitolerans TaxID=1403566 RepID=A0ABP5IPW0_9MICO